MTNLHIFKNMTSNSIDVSIISADVKSYFDI